MSAPSARRVFSPGSRRPAPVRGPVRTAVLAAVLMMAVTLTACDSEKSATSTPKASPTPISGLNSAALQVPRIDFCSSVPDEAVTAALGGKPDSKKAHGNGDKEDLDGVGEDVLHEMGCSWSTDDGSAARAWVFARPVEATFARRVIASSKDKQGCRAVSGPAFGKPTVTQVCRLAGGDERVRHAGLFGQTWLSCEVQAPSTKATGVRERADAWCVQVANALDTAR